MARLARALRLASRSAASVSAVSPDWVMTTVSVCVVDDRIAVAELGAVVDLHRHARQLLDQELAGQRGVPARAARDNQHAIHRRQRAVVEADLVEDHRGRATTTGGRAACRRWRAAARRSP